MDPGHTLSRGRYAIRRDETMIEGLNNSGSLPVMQRVVQFAAQRHVLIILDLQIGECPLQHRLGLGRLGVEACHLGLRCPKLARAARLEIRELGRELVALGLHLGELRVPSGRERLLLRRLLARL